MTITRYRRELILILSVHLFFPVMDENSIVPFDGSQPLPLYENLPSEYGLQAVGYVYMCINNYYNIVV